MQTLIASVAVPVPLRQSFDFIVPQSQAIPAKGARVLVPFGKRRLVGVVLELKKSSDFPLEKLKSIDQVLDVESCFDEQLWQTLNWVSKYYLAPIGEVFETALPVALRKFASNSPKKIKSWSLSDYGRSAPIEELKKAPLQLAIIQRFQRHESLSPEDFKHESSGWRNAVNSLIEKGWIEEFLLEPMLSKPAIEEAEIYSLTSEQAECVKTLLPALDASQFNCYLVKGVTGSGKTQVYFEAMKKVLERGQQVLMLVPEIGLTPQLIQRAEQFFAEAICAIHSRLNEI